MTQLRKGKTTPKRKSEGAKVTLGDTPGMKHALDTALVEVTTPDHPSYPSQPLAGAFLGFH